MPVPSLSAVSILNVTLSLVSNEWASQNSRIDAGWVGIGVAVFSARAELSAQDGELTADFSMRVAHRHIG